jgi:hypothetical protein
MIQGLMTFSALVTYESGFESLLREGCDHVVHLTLADFKASEDLYNEVFEAAGVAADKMLELMWSLYGVEVARKELDQVTVSAFMCFCVCGWSSLTSACAGKGSV